MRWLTLKLIKIYQKWISPLFGPQCRFYPTCSQYAVECYENFGWFRASMKFFRRLLKCHPFHPGGYDPLKPPSKSQVYG